MLRTKPQDHLLSIAIYDSYTNAVSRQARLEAALKILNQPPSGARKDKSTQAEEEATDGEDGQEGHDDVNFSRAEFDDEQRTDTTDESTTSERTADGSTSPHPSNSSAAAVTPAVAARIDDTNTLDMLASAAVHVAASETISTTGEAPSAPLAHATCCGLYNSHDFFGTLVRKAFRLEALNLGDEKIGGPNDLPISYVGKTNSMHLHRLPPGDERGMFVFRSKECAIDIDQRELTSHGICQACELKRRHLEKSLRRAAERKGP